MSPKNKIYISILAVFCTLLMLGLSAQTKRISTPALRPVTANVIPDSTVKDSLAAILNLIDSLHQKKNDSIPPIAIDSLKNDSLPSDSTKKSKKAGLDDVVEYKANDSIVFLGNNPAFLIHNTKINKKGDWNIFLKYVLLYTIVGQYLRALAEGLVLSESQTFSIFGMTSGLYGHLSFFAYQNSSIQRHPTCLKLRKIMLQPRF